MEKHIVLMRGTNRLAKNFILSTIQNSTKFHYFCKVRALSNFRQKINFPKIASNCGETLLLMRGTYNLAKNNYLITIKDSKKISLFL